MKDELIMLQEIEEEDCYAFDEMVEGEVEELRLSQLELE